MGIHGDSDEFGNRMKAYEAAETDRSLDSRLPIYARIDGRSFSNFTRNMQRPFDPRMTAAMVGTTKTLVEKTHALIGYTQSDEISLTWLFEAESEPLFGGKVHKLTSVLASLAAASFQMQIRRHFDAAEADKLCAALPHFDARAFNVPDKSEASNAFLWRALDAQKNAVSMAARAAFSHKQLQGADQSAMRGMMAAKGIHFDECYPASFRLGTWVRRVVTERRMTAEELERIPERHRPEPDALIARGETREVDMPSFRTVRNRIEVIFDGVSPVS